MSSSCGVDSGRKVGALSNSGNDCSVASVPRLQVFQRFATVADFTVLIHSETSTCWNQMAKNHVFLQTNQAVDFACQSSLGQDLRCFLELAAEIKLLLWTEAFVIPSNWTDAFAAFGFLPLAGLPPSASICALDCSIASFGTMAPSANSLSPGSVTLSDLASSSFLRRSSKRSTTKPDSKEVSPGFSIFTLRNMRAMMTSTCLSLISTRWLRYTC